MMDEQRLQEIQGKLSKVGISARLWMRELIAEVRRLQQQEQAWRDRFRVLVGDDSPDGAGNAVITLQSQRDAALAERDALYTAQMKQIDYSVQLQRLIESLSRDGDVPYPELHHHQKIVDAKAALTEARRVLREASGWLEPEISRGPADSRWVQMMRDVAAVLAQDESAD